MVEAVRSVNWIELYLRLIWRLSPVFSFSLSYSEQRVVWIVDLVCATHIHKGTYSVNFGLYIRGIRSCVMRLASPGLKQNWMWSTIALRCEVEALQTAVGAQAQQAQLRMNQVYSLLCWRTHKNVSQKQRQTRVFLWGCFYILRKRWQEQICFNRMQFALPS